MELKGAHVLITGASRGIGAALAREFARADATVSLTARSAEALEELAAELGGTAFPADLMDSTAVDSLVERVEAKCGPIDVLVNNAGVEGHGWIHEAEAGILRNVVRLNLETPIVLTRNVLPGMIQRGTGHIVMISSLAGTGGFPGLSAYGATKAGLTNFAAAIALELVGTGVNTTVAAPGPVDTDMWDHIEEDTEVQPVIDRLNRIHLLPKKSPELVAEKTVAAVLADRRNVRLPRRLISNHWLREMPTRLTGALIRGVPVGPAASKS